MTREYDATKSSTIKKSGITYKASVGAFGKDNSESGTNKKGAIKDVTAGIKAKPATKSTTSGPKTTKGAKKTWTGPKITEGDLTGTAGGYTEWTKGTSGTTGTLTKFTCQSATMNKAFPDGAEAQVYLWDKSGKTNDLWQIKEDGMSYYHYKSLTVTETKDGDSIKDQMKVDASMSGDLNPDGNGLKIKDTSGMSGSRTLDITKSKMATDEKSFTACYQDVNTNFGTGKYKGESKAYTQGIYYDADRNTKDGKRIEQAVTVQFAAEGATSLLTTLGAVAFGVAALAF